MTPPKVSWRSGALVALGALLGGTAAWGLRPARVRVETQERVVYRDRIVEMKAETQAKAVEATTVKRVVIYRDRVVTPDGTQRERVVESHGEVARTELRHLHVTLAASERATELEQARIERREEERPTHSWQVGALVGVPVSWPPEPHVGLSIQRRLWGPVSAGAWTFFSTGHIAKGDPTPALLGVGLSLELP